ncbi:MAG: methylmalonyl Co-A mutase-associated GTPase MeaB [Azoarcus sp.]|nr:methylmalonyl Co-A mutase-associated GTPase MeaB [Azoarcus sp.]
MSIAAILQGEVGPAARLMRDLDDEMAQARQILRQLYPHTGRAHVIGITGSPGAGKSCLTNELISAFRKRGQTVGVVAVDPSSPFSGGAILGDRVRMQPHDTDAGVFVRSLATRGHMGGLSRSTGDVVDVMDAMGKAVVIVETVGVGQDELDIIRLAHTTLVVQVPGLGDDIQSIKAGILEIASVFVVNKADLPGADLVTRDLEAMLQMRTLKEGALTPEIIKTEATRGKGIDELVAAIDRHRKQLQVGDGWADMQRQRLEDRFAALLRERLFEQAERYVSLSIMSNASLRSTF